MSIDFGTLVENPLRHSAVVGSFLAIKIVMLWLVARPLGVPAKQRRWFAKPVERGSEFAFVVLARRNGGVRRRNGPRADAGGHCRWRRRFSGADAHGEDRDGEARGRMKSTKNNRRVIVAGVWTIWSDSRAFAAVERVKMVVLVTTPIISKRCVNSA